MRPIDLGPHRARVVEAEQFVPVIDQHVEVRKEILSQNAADAAIERAEVHQAVYQHLLVGNFMGTGLEKIELSESGSFTQPSARDHGRALSSQMEFGGQGGTNDGGIGACIQEEVVRTGV